MRKEIKTVSIVCDICETPLSDSNRDSSLNESSIKEPYLKKGDIDLCFICAGKILTKNIIHKIPEETLSNFVNDFKKINSIGIKDVPIMLFGDNQEKTSLEEIDTTTITETTETKSKKTNTNISFLSDL